MKRKPALTLAFVIGAALVLGVLLGVTALATSGNASANFLAAASPSPRSNETASHEQNETAAREAAENNGTLHPGGPGGHNGPSNEAPAHEATESAAQEAAEQT